MSKRPAEMEGLYAYEAIEIRGPHPSGEWVERDPAERIIRSLRAKLFRERARWHKMEAEANEQACCYSAMGRHYRAFARFTLIAADIERGER